MIQRHRLKYQLLSSSLIIVIVEASAMEELNEQSLLGDIVEDVASSREGKVVKLGGRICISSRKVRFNDLQSPWGGVDLTTVFREVDESEARQKMG